MADKNGRLHWTAEAWTWKDTTVICVAIALVAVSGWFIRGQGHQAWGLLLDAGGFVLVWWFTLGAGDVFYREPDGGNTFWYERLHSGPLMAVSVAGVLIVIAGFGLQLWGVLSHS